MLTNTQLQAEVAAVVREGESWATHDTQHAPDPQVALRDQVRYLARYAPGAGCAAAVIDISGTPVVPLELPNLTPAGDPITDLDGVLHHWRHRPQDGVGVPAGWQPNGSTVVALQFADDATWKVWLTEHAVTVDRFRDDNGTEQARPRSLPLGDYILTRWSSPARPGLISTSVAVGNREIAEQASRLLDPQRAALREPVTMVWEVTSRQPDGRRLTVRSRQLGNGVQVLGERSVIPWAVTRPSGWRLVTSRPVPITSDEPMPEWLVDLMGAKWSAR
jgi:hypothetical protein